tara:strand:+ start:1044 stop:1358 length:315 start_codon:yes stop_codon:yes gene_type:complete
MPIYTFENIKTGKVYDEMMTISEMESYLKKNKHIRQQIHSVNIVGGIKGITHKNDQGFKEVLSKIAEKHPASALAKEHGKKSIKQIRTEQVIKKHKARRNAKNK